MAPVETAETARAASAGGVLPQAAIPGRGHGSRSDILSSVRSMGVVETGSPGAQGVPAHTRLASDWDVLVMSALDPEPLLQGSRTLLELSLIHI